MQRSKILLAAALAALVVSITAAPAGAESRPAEVARDDCGVRILSTPLLVAGVPTAPRGLPGVETIDEIIAEVVEGIVSSSGSGPPEVQCQPVGAPEDVLAMRASPGGKCSNAGVSGARLKRRLAAKAVRCLINQERVHRGLRGLGPRESLRTAAKRHSRKMVSSGCFAHRCGGERELVGRVVASGYLPCGCTWTVGEDLAWGERDLGSPAAIVKAWMNSPPHRAIILLKSLADVDIGVVRGRPGNARANAATYTADFGVRR